MLSFRVDRYDDRGNRLAAAGVEFPGYRGGQLGDGEQVEVSGSWHHGTLRADEVTNLATGSSLLGIPGWVRKLGIVVAGLVVLGAAVFVVSLLVHRGSAGVVTVPDVVGLPVNVASSNLSDAGLSPEGALEPNPTVPFGDVIRTSPAAGSSVATHTTVIVYSSTGPPH